MRSQQVDRLLAFGQRMKRLVPVIAVVVLVGLMVALRARAFSDPVPMQRLNWLRKGMGPDEVQTVLGPPTRIYDSGQWTYQRPLVFGFVNIRWQEDGTYDGDFNYERF
ncbi:MAG: hypothetical protein IT365_09680 [Candidatus Hydrogenedentes bacterium]|nr:hypothetical protein [Candidatus Hydrogenedentota bacterium]